MRTLAFGLRTLQLAAMGLMLGIWLAGCATPQATVVSEELPFEQAVAKATDGPVSYTHLDVYKRQGQMQPGVTLRDLVHAIPLYAIKAGLLTVAKAGKKNVFSGRILEIEGLPDLKVEQAFELSDASAERSAAGCTIKLNPAPIKEYLLSLIHI